MYNYCTLHSNNIDAMDKLLSLTFQPKALVSDLIIQEVAFPRGELILLDAVVVPTILVGSCY